MPPRYVLIDDEKKLLLATYLSGGKYTFAEMKAELKTFLVDVRGAPDDTDTRAEAAMMAARLLEEAMQKPTESFEQIEDCRPFFGIAGSSDRATVAAAVANLPPAIANRYHKVPSLGPDVIEEAVKGLQAHIGANAGDKPDCDLLIGYLQKNAAALRKPLTDAIARKIRQAAPVAANALGDAVITALIAASHPGLYQAGGGGVGVDLAGPQPGSAGSAPDNVIYEMLTFGGAPGVPGQLGRRAGVAPAVGAAFEWVPPLHGRSIASRGQNVQFSAGGAGATAIDNSLRATVGSSVLEHFALAAEAVRDEFLATKPPIANSLILAEIAANAAATLRAHGNKAEGLDLSNLFLVNPANANIAGTLLVAGGAGHAVANAVNLAAVGHGVPQAGVNATGVSAAGVAATLVGQPVPDEHVLMQAFWEKVVARIRPMAPGATPQPLLPKERVEDAKKRVSALALESYKDDECKGQADEVGAGRIETLEKEVTSAGEKFKTMAQGAHNVIAASAVAPVAVPPVVVLPAQLAAAGEQLQALHHYLAAADACNTKAQSLSETGDSALPEMQTLRLRGRALADSFEEELKTKIRYDEIRAAAGAGAGVAKEQQMLKSQAAMMQAIDTKLAGLGIIPPPDWLQNLKDGVGEIRNALLTNRALIVVPPAAPAVRARGANQLEEIHEALYQLDKIINNQPPNASSPEAIAAAKVLFDDMIQAEVAYTIANINPVPVVAAARGQGAQAAVDILIAGKKQKIERMQGQAAVGAVALTAFQALEAQRLEILTKRESVVEARSVQKVSICGSGELRTAVDKKQELQQNGGIQDKGNKINVTFKDGKLTVEEGGVKGMRKATEAACDMWSNIVISGGSSAQREAGLKVILEQVRAGKKINVTLEGKITKPQQELITQIDQTRNAVKNAKTGVIQGDPYTRKIVNAAQEAEQQFLSQRKYQNTPLSDKEVDKLKQKRKEAEQKASDQYFKENPKTVVSELQRRFDMLKEEVAESTKDAVSKEIVLILISAKHVGEKGVFVDAKKLFTDFVKTENQPGRGVMLGGRHVATSEGAKLKAFVVLESKHEFVNKSEDIAGDPVDEAKGMPGLGS